jgi:hypothetical protein
VEDLEAAVADAAGDGGNRIRETVEMKRKRSNDPSAKAAGAVAAVPVAVVTSRVEAELIVGMLRSHGLRAAVSADDAAGQEPELQLQGVRVLVASSDEALARRLLAADDGIPS